MNKKLIAVIIVAIILIAIAYWYFIYRPANTLVDGTPCKKSGIPGTIVNGTCVTTPFGNPLPFNFTPKK